MKKLTKKLKELFAPCVYTDKKKILKAIQEDSSLIDTSDLISDGVTDFNRQIEYYDGYIDITISIRTTVFEHETIYVGDYNSHDLPPQYEVIDEIDHVSLIVYNQHQDMVDIDLTFDDIYSVINHLES